MTSDDLRCMPGLTAERADTVAGSSGHAPGLGRPRNVLFLCTHNSARSVIAEGLLTRLGAGRWTGHSAGSHPSGRVNPFALAVLRSLDCPIERFHSKHWGVYAEADAPGMDIVITVCNDAAGEACPLWPGEPTRLHWGFCDPSNKGSSDAERLAAFEATASMIQARIASFLQEQGRADHQRP